MKFAIIGLGYIAHKHLEAIKAVGGTLVAACDVRDSVGILDRYFPNVPFFNSEHLFWDFVGDAYPDYVVICTPNAQHHHQIRLAFVRSHHVICEKPVCTSLAQAQSLALSLGGRFYSILQLRLHPVYKALKAQAPLTGRWEMEYYTPRGPWYDKSWKSQPEHGGTLLNIGVHMFDALIGLFGYPKNVSSFYVKMGK